MNLLRSAKRISDVGPDEFLQRFIIKKEQLRGIKEIGYGSGVTVKTATWTKTTGEVKEVAVKKFCLSSESTRYKEAVLREAKLLLKLEHRNIVEAYGVCTEDMLAIVMEKAEFRMNLEGSERICRSLRNLLDEFQQYELPFEFKILALHHICKGLQYLHSRNIVHNDLKCANVLVFNKENENDVIFKICDFGECRKELQNLIESSTADVLTDETQARKTIPFTAPERLQQDNRSLRNSDIYSLGMLMYEVLRHDLNFPWQEEFDDVVLENIKSSVLNGRRPRFKEYDHDHSDLKLIRNLENVIVKCWQQLPEDRPNIEQVLDLVSLLYTQSQKSTALGGIEDESLNGIYEKLFEDPSLAYQFIEEVGKWKKETVEKVINYFEALITELNDREKTFNIVNLTADSVSIGSGVAGIVGFALLFNPITFVSGVAMCATAGVLGGAGGITYGSVMIDKKRKDDKAQEDAKEEFKRAGIDLDALTQLVNKICAFSNGLLGEFPAFDQERMLTAIHGYLLRTWEMLREIASNDLVIHGIQDILNNFNIDFDVKGTMDKVALTYNVLSTVRAEAITGVSAGLSIKSIYQVFDATADISPASVATVNTFGALAKSAQVLQSVGLIFSVISVSTGIYGVVKNSQTLKEGSKNKVAEMFRLYQRAIKNFWWIKVIVDPSLDQKDAES